MVFWASFEPWLNPMKPALASCALPKIAETMRGRTRLKQIMIAVMSSKPQTNPATGDSNMGRTTFGQSPVDQRRTAHFPPEPASVAPQRPPMRAWDELDGRPSHQVRSPQAMAETSAQRSTGIVTAFVSTRPFPIVVATAVPARAPTRFQTDAQATASRGVRTFVETTVAIAFAVSWNPLM